MITSCHVGEMKCCGGVTPSWCGWSSSRQHKKTQTYLFAFSVDMLDNWKSCWIAVFWACQWDVGVSLQPFLSTHSFYKSICCLRVSSTETLRWMSVKSTSKNNPTWIISFEMTAGTQRPSPLPYCRSGSLLCRPSLCDQCAQKRPICPLMKTFDSFSGALPRSPTQRRRAVSVRLIICNPIDCTPSLHREHCFSLLPHYTYFSLKDIFFWCVQCSLMMEIHSCHLLQA